MKGTLKNKEFVEKWNNLDKYNVTIQEESGIEIQGYTFSTKISGADVGGEIEYERSEDKRGNTKFTAPKSDTYGNFKGGGSKGRDEDMIQDRMDKRTALMQAIELGKAQGVDSEAILKVADKFHNWLKGQSNE